ncbi:MAG: hypothetical protein JF616_01705 [Fibrobacteres bacterium]|nr:hypothetical protein [Fibrobacterota bacterium]
MAICGLACMAVLPGCIAGPEAVQSGTDSDNHLALSASISNPGPASKSCPKTSLRQCEDGFLPLEADACVRRLVSEPWDAFDAGLWRGDGDQRVVNGNFTAAEGAESATADWLAGKEGALSDTRTLRFSNQLAMDESVAFDSSLREGLFFLSGDSDASFSNYLFVSIQYSRAQRRVLLESFGASDGVEFDNVVEAPWNPAPRAPLSLQTEAAPGFYRVLLDGMLADSIPVSKPLACITVAEVGVQSGEFGRFGLIDNTTIEMVMPLAAAAPGHKGRPGLRNCRRHHGDAIHRKDWRRKARF